MEEETAGLKGEGFKGAEMLPRQSNRWEFPKQRERRDFRGEERADMRVPSESKRGRER
jgi:hypothetical protein